MKVINFFGGAGCGKSTTAAMLYAEMKKKHINAELVGEEAKIVYYKEKQPCQLDLLNKQYQRVKRLDGKVDYAICDSPILLNAFYAPEIFPKEFGIVVKYFFDQFENHNYLIKRDTEYVQEGRWQTESEAKEIDKKIYYYLLEEYPDFSVVSKNRAVNQIFKDFEIEI